MSEESTTLYIQKVPAAITQEQLQSGLLAVAKELGIAKTVVTVTLNEKRRYAHVVYTTHESAEKALKALKKTPIEGQVLSADWSVVPAKEEDSKQALYITNLATTTEISEIQPLFEKFGEVERAFIITDKATKASKGQALVEFKEEDSAEKALELDGTDIGGQTITVQYAKGKRAPRGKGKQQNSTPRSTGQKRKADGENGNGKQQNSAKKPKAETPKAETRSATAAKTDSPKKETSKKEAKKDTPKKETPKETKKETPAVASKDTPKKETPKNQAKATPKKETPKKESTPSKGQEKSKGKK